MGARAPAGAAAWGPRGAGGRARRGARGGPPGGAPPARRPGGRGGVRARPAPHHAGAPAADAGAPEPDDPHDQRREREPLMGALLLLLLAVPLWSGGALQVSVLPDGAVRVPVHGAAGMPEVHAVPGGVAVELPEARVERGSAA